MSRVNYRDTIVTNAEKSEQEKQAQQQHERIAAKETKKKKKGGMNPMDMMQGMFGGGE